MSTLLHKLPVDLLPTVIENMTVEDTMNLKKSIDEYPDYNAIKHQCDDRLSVAKYLSKMLGNGDEWLSVLAECSGYISGSISLNFFVPGCTLPSSDCDVYVSEYKDMDCFIQHGDKLNIKWFDNADMVKIQLASGKDTVRMRTSEFRKIHESGRLYDVLDGKYEPIGSRTSRYRHDSVELTFTGRHISVKQLHDRGWYGTQGILDMKYGQILKNGTVVPVQLILQADRNSRPFNAIFNFHSTCVQSFIGAYTACHLYGKEAAKKHSHCWINNVRQHVPDIHFPSRPTPSDLGSIGHLAPEWKKYEDRGFSYFSLAVYVGYQNRQIGDDQCTIVEYPGPTGTSVWSAKKEQDIVRRIKWKQYNNKRPILQFHEVTAVKRRPLPNDFMSSIQPLVRQS